MVDPGTIIYSSIGDDLSSSPLLTNKFAHVYEYIYDEKNQMTFDIEASVMARPVSISTARTSRATGTTSRALPQDILTISSVSFVPLRFEQDPTRLDPN